MTEKFLEVFVGPNWAPAAAVLSGILILMSVLAILFCYIYYKGGKQEAVQVLFVLAGLNYIELSVTHNMNFFPLQMGLILTGIWLILRSGMILGACLPKDSKEDLLSAFK